jgi:hypothetical protein
MKMKAIRCRAVLLAFSVAVAGMIEPSGAQAQGLTPETQTNFQWFSGLGFPDVKGCPFVRVTTGRWSQGVEGPPQNSFLRGFLLGTNGSAFNVVTTDLHGETFTNTPPGTPEHQRVGFEILSLQEEATARLNALRNPPADDGFGRGFALQLSERAQVFVLAWDCWRQGLDALAQDLYAEGKKMPAMGNTPDQSSTFQEALEKDIGHAAMWRAVLAFEDTSISRPELLARFEAVVKNYPHSEHHERAQKTADLLRQMIAEDQEHAKTAPKDLNALPVQEQIRELIFQLRDQNGHQWGQPGWCDIFQTQTESTNTPAHQLVALGYAAVPQLITAIKSPTLTRSVGYWRNFTFSHTVLTVGDSAVAILNRISGRSFFSPRSTFSYMSMDGAGVQAQDEAQAWWDEFQKKGEKQMLLDAVSIGGEDAAAQGKLLSERYPEAAAAALIRGASAAKNAWTRTTLVEEIGELPDASTAEFLQDEMLNGPQIQARVAAAYQLRQRGKREAVSAMIQEWEKLPLEKGEDFVDRYKIHDFLASCDSVPAIEALDHNLRQRPVDTKLEVVEAVGDTNQPFWGHASEHQSSATIAAVEKLLAAELEDTDERTGMSGGLNGMSFSDPRVCDIAACLLAERWPDRYAMKLPGTRKSRERQRIECLNSWRSAHQLPTLPMPQTRNTPVSPAEAAKVTLVEWSPESAKPSDSFAARVGSLKDKLLRAEDLIGLITNFAGNPELGASGLKIKAVKDEDLTGVCLTFTLLPGPGRVTDWQWAERVKFGPDNINSSGGTGNPDSYGSYGLVEAVQKVTTGPPETPFEINMEMKASPQR